MKLNCWLLLAAMLATSLLAQQADTNAPASPPIATPAPAPMATNSATSETPAKAPATKKKKSSRKPKHTQKPAAAMLETVPLMPGPAVVVATRVNVRGQPRLKSEVVGQLTNGQPVTVLQEITRNNSAADEPSAWAKILLPPGSHVWVNTSFIDATNKTVRPRHLNLRAGPAERFSVLGRLERGDAVNEIGTKGEWTEIEAPTNAYAFVAAQYLKQEAPGALASAGTNTPAATEPVPPATTIAESPTVAPAPTDAPATPAPADSATSTNAVADTGTPAVSTPVDEPPPKRIVEREGLVRGTTSIQAPTKFELISADNGHTIDYLYTSAPTLDLRRYKGLRIVVTGEEGLDERWGNTPIITIQKIQVIE